MPVAEGTAVMTVRTAIELYTDGELARLRAEWPALVRQAASPPQASWEDWKEALLDEAASPVEELVIRGALAALVKTAPAKTSGETLREIVRLAYGAVRLGHPSADPSDGLSGGPSGGGEVDMS
jgi:hypothetical protein